eukprot:SAG31_NODE_614_length_13525_cov_4.312230_3_plen_134_part_00
MSHLHAAADQELVASPRMIGPKSVRRHGTTELRKRLEGHTIPYAHRLHFVGKGFYSNIDIPILRSQAVRHFCVVVKPPELNKKDIHLGIERMPRRNDIRHLLELSNKSLSMASTCSAYRRLPVLCERRICQEP